MPWRLTALCSRVMPDSESSHMKKNPHSRANPGHGRLQGKVAAVGETKALCPMRPDLDRGLSSWGLRAILWVLDGMASKHDSTAIEEVVL